MIWASGWLRNVARDSRGLNQDRGAWVDCVFVGVFGFLFWDLRVLEKAARVSGVWVDLLPIGHGWAIDIQ